MTQQQQQPPPPPHQSQPPNARPNQAPYSASSLNYVPSANQHHLPHPPVHDRSRDDLQPVDIKQEERRDRDGYGAQLPPPGPSPVGQALHLHQPVALGPRTAHGPNGLLNETAPAQPLAHPGPPYGALAQQPHHPQHQSQSQLQQQQQPQILSAQSNQTNEPRLRTMHPDHLAAAQAVAVGPGQQPILNDALSYLDQVKVQFVDQPDVYNRFLDIMKDFKSMAIDTPGVIDRVSTLFAGNPQLIQGFNTFLPPGYRIECGVGDDPNAIRVMTPMGNTLLTTSSGPKDAGPRRGAAEEIRRIANGNQSPAHYSPGGRPTAARPAGGLAHQIEAREHDLQTVHQQEQRGVSQLTSAVSAATNGGLAHQPVQSPIADRQTTPGQPAQDEADSQEKRAPVEFNHAISYVNKIKNRFSSQPDIYKQFLEILQTYQRESKPIQDVFGQVTKLFNGAPDLLEDFKQFLPESAAQAKAAALARQQAEEAAILSNVRGDSHLQQTPRSENRLPPVGNFAPTPTVNKDAKRKRGDKAHASAAMAETGATKATHAQSLATNKRVKYAQQQKPSADATPLSPTLVPALPEPMGPSHSTAANDEELAFFDRAKKMIGNKNTMNEFLKLCNLFTQDIIDRSTLVNRARNFIGGNPELFRWFQNWIASDDEPIVIENKPRVPTSRIALSNCRSLGPSYRLLPRRDRLKPCSGRDELCNEVLNDDWASHPTWASEDSGFIAHRKNVHEEGLHKIEEERHDYDHNIEAIGRTIQLLEPIAQKLNNMPEKERETVDIHPGLGGQSQTIHKKIIMKLYGREPGQQIIDQLHIKPYHIIPVLLNRLKQKAEEWKSMQREWEKVWREQTQKMFWKSLDHQAVNAKQADKRQFQTKTLVGEVQTRYEEQKKQRALGASASQISQPQMTIHFDDTDVILDATYLVLIYAEQMHSTEFPRLTAFIKDFVPLFFGLDNEWFNMQLRAKMNESPTGALAFEAITTLDDGISRPRKINNKRDGDLRRGVLERGTRGRTLEGSGTPLSRASTPGPSERADEEMSEAAAVPDEDADNAVDTWAEYPLGLKHNFQNKDVVLNEPYRRSVYNLYGNVSIYCFMRMFVILYERLHKLKMEEQRVHIAVRAAMAAKPAIELGLVDKLPTDFFADVSPSANYYRQILDMLERFIVNGTDFAPIEETLRRYYMDCGWQLYSFEKLSSALVRFAIAILSSESRDKSWDVLQCFKKDRVKEETTYQDEMTYRKQVERLVKDGDVYKIAYVSLFDTIRMLSNQNYRTRTDSR